MREVLGDGGSTVMATGGETAAATMAMGAVIAFSLTTRLTAAGAPPLECLPPAEAALPAGAARTTPAAVVEVVLTSAVEVVLRRLMVTVFRLMLGDLGWMGAVADLPEKGLAGEREEEVLCLALEFMSFLALLPAAAPPLLPPEVGVIGLLAPPDPPPL